MEQNKTSKYFKYAVGEILLVVIGILIALQINNWNESRKDSKIEAKALVALQQEFSESLNRINGLIKRKINQENKGRAYAKTLASDSLTIEEKVAAAAPPVHRGILGANNPVLNSLMNTGDFTKIRSDSLKTALNNWFNVLEKYLINEAQYEAAVIKRLKFLEDKFYRGVVKAGDYTLENWPGSFRPENLEVKNLALEAKFVTSIQFYNLNAELVQRLYIQLISLNKLKEQNTEILELINKELRL